MRCTTQQLKSLLYPKESFLLVKKIEAKINKNGLDEAHENYTINLDHEPLKLKPVDNGQDDNRNP